MLDGKAVGYSITDMNAMVFAEFTRITGLVDAFRFTSWWAEREREVVKLQAEDARAAAARWARLQKPERQLRVLAFLREQPSLAIVNKVLYEIKERAA